MKILSFDNSNGCIQEIDLNALFSGYARGLIEGLSIEGNSSSLKINRGYVDIAGKIHSLSSYKIININTMPVIGNPPPTEGTCWIYARYKDNDNELTADDFYISGTKPNADIFDKTINIYAIPCRNYASIRGCLEYRCIGSFYKTGTIPNNIVPFENSYFGKWETKWLPFDFFNIRFSSVCELKHGLGIIPRKWYIWFRPDMDSEGYTVQSYYNQGGFFMGSKGVTVWDRITEDSVYMRTGRYIYFYRDSEYEGWFNDGYFKLIVEV